jgi:hypothetical protein
MSARQFHRNLGRSRLVERSTIRNHLTMLRLSCITMTCSSPTKRHLSALNTSGGKGQLAVAGEHGQWSIGYQGLCLP